MKTVTIKYGLGNTLQKEFPDNATVGSIVQDASVRAVLGYGANVRPKVDGVEQSLHAPIGHGDTIEIESVANAKAH